MKEVHRVVQTANGPFSMHFNVFLAMQANFQLLQRYALIYYYFLWLYSLAIDWQIVKPVLLAEKLKYHNFKNFIQVKILYECYSNEITP